MAKSFPIPTHRQFQDLTGQWFSRWLVQSYAGPRGPHHYWNCVCDCGTEKAVAKNSLSNGLSRSCGCLNSQVASQRWERKRVFVSCAVNGCDSQATAKGLCKLHYERVRKGKGPGDTRTTRAKKSRWVQENAGYNGDDCLIWPFSVSDHGRGSVKIGGAVMSAPRYMCTLAHGAPPTPDHDAAHSCGKGHLGCMTPGHLSWKTAKENEADKIVHGTIRRGEKINTAKLSESDVREIRRRACVETCANLASEFGVSTAQISAIKNRQAWAWL